MPSLEGTERVNAELVAREIGDLIVGIIVQVMKFVILEIYKPSCLGFEEIAQGKGEGRIKAVVVGEPVFTQVYPHGFVA